MYFKSSIAILLLFIFLSCNSNTQQQSASDSTVIDTTASSACYQYASAKDTIALHVIKMGQSVAGRLTYTIYEKDKNAGTISGNMQDSTLIAYYTFQSEGMQSVRQIAFKMENGSFVAAYGEIVTRNDTTFFKNTDSLQLNHSFKLIPVTCQ